MYRGRPRRWRRRRRRRWRWQRWRWRRGGASDAELWLRAGAPAVCLAGAPRWMARRVHIACAGLHRQRCSEAMGRRGRRLHHPVCQRPHRARGAAPLQGHRPARRRRQAPRVEGLLLELQKGARGAATGGARCGQGGGAATGPQTKGARQRRRRRRRHEDGWCQYRERDGRPIFRQGGGRPRAQQAVQGTHCGRRIRRWRDRTRSEWTCNERRGDPERPAAHLCPARLRVCVPPARHALLWGLALALDT